MSKAQKITYWIATVWLSLGMVSSGIVQFIHMDEEVQLFQHLGYPLYFMTLLAVWKFLGTIAILVPRFPLVKEWAYAGFFFAMSGAAISHIVMKDSIGEIAPTILLLVLTILSWALRPQDRRSQPLIASL